MNIEAGKYYRTRSGCKARIYMTKGHGKFPIHGTLFIEDDCYEYRWTSSGFGSSRFASGEDGFDLIEEWKEEPPQRRNQMTNKTPAESILAELESLGRLVNCEPLSMDGFQDKVIEVNDKFPSLLAACKVMAEALEESLHNWESGEHCDACANNDVIYESLKKALSDCAKLLSGSEGE